MSDTKVNLDPSEDLKRKHALAVEFAKVIIQGTLASGKQVTSARDVSRLSWDLVWALEREGKAIGGA